MYNKICPYCKGEFQARVPHTVVCPSTECRQKKIREVAIKHYYKKNNRELPVKESIRQCLICEKGFKPKRADSKCCSLKCSRGAEYLRKPIYKNICKHCGNEFETRKKWTIYCSSGCVNTVFKTKPSVNYFCENCGEDFEHRYKRINPVPKFCSKSCSSSGEFNTQWKGGKIEYIDRIRQMPEYIKWYGKVKKRDGKVCQICKTDCGPFQVDHVIPLSLIVKRFDIQSLDEANNCSVLWDINNGRVLCVPCHKNTDTYGQKVQKLLKEFPS